jgi:hypothetical protein
MAVRVQRPGKFRAFFRFGGLGVGYRPVAAVQEFRATGSNAAVAAIGLLKVCNSNEPEAAILHSSLS